jgi:hypothetical protein
MQHLDSPKFELETHIDHDQRLALQNPNLMRVHKPVFRTEITDFDWTPQKG